MKYNIGDVIAEFRQNDDPDEGYTNKLKGLCLVKGIMPQDGDWQIVCVTDTGYTHHIPMAELENGSGKYVVGGHDIVMHAAGIDETPWLDMRKTRR